MKLSHVLLLSASLLSFQAYAMEAPEDDNRPHEHSCPITLEIMRDPVVAADGYSYEKEAIIRCFAAGRTNSPITGLPLETQNLIPNHALKSLIMDWKPGAQSSRRREEIASVERERLAGLRQGIPPIAYDHEEIYTKFLKGRLIYKPNKYNDIGKIELKIADLADPLEGTFNLSQCGDTGKYLSISTGYKKRTNHENANKLEIWFTPRFLIEREINDSASHFKNIFPAKWPETAPVGIIWTLGTRDNESKYDYLTTQTINELSNNNLDDLKREQEIMREGPLYSVCLLRNIPSKFHVYFKN